MKKHKAQLNISRPSYGDGKKKISITVKDSDAKVRFLDIEIDYDKFAECITGLSEIECEMEVRQLDVVGLKREIMDIKFKLPRSRIGMPDEVLHDHAKLNTPDGWKCSLYFNSQNSFFTKGETQYARTTALRWVKK